MTQATKRSIIRRMAASNILRPLLNQFHDRLSFAAKARFHQEYAKIFRDGADGACGEWVAHFLGHRLRLPMRTSWYWLDWDFAVSLLGHDAEIKQTYVNLITSDCRPNLFVDIGANYGTHSLLFLGVGIPTIAFEPNSDCCEHFRMICELNQLQGRWEAVAVGRETGEADLAYPDRDTWYGSLSDSVQSGLEAHFGQLIVQKIGVRRLDDYLEYFTPGSEILIKIDVQGLEADVIIGAAKLLSQDKVKIIFESEEQSSRRTLTGLLSDQGYQIYDLPWSPNGHYDPLNLQQFEASGATNFIALRG